MVNGSDIIYANRVNMPDVISFKINLLHASQAVFAHIGTQARFFGTHEAHQFPVLFVKLN